MAKIHKYRDESGQIGLIAMLIGAVLMTFGLGAVSQSIVETKTAREETSATQAFNYAEMGIEEVLNNAGHLDADGTGGEMTKTIPGYGVLTYSSVPSDVYQADILEGHSANVDMYDESAGTSAVSPLIVTWSSTGCPGVIVSIIDRQGTTLQRNAYKRNGCGPSGDNFTLISCGGATCSINEGFSMVGPGVARIKVVYENTTLTVSGNSLPVQGHDIKAQLSITATQETKTVESKRVMPAVAGIFDYALFSGSDITQ